MKTKIIFSIAGFLLLFNTANSQSNESDDTADERKTNFKVAADIVSTYIWRGTVASSNPNIQPTLAIVSGGFEAGVWGSTDYRASYKELDPYLSYTLKVFKIGVTDYNWIFVNPSYFDFRNSSTDHILEVSLSFLGTEKMPLSISVNTMVYGADKKWDNNTGQFSTAQNFSTYIELGWAFKSCNVLMGVTPFNGYYGAGYGKVDGFAVCNLGVSSLRSIKITPDFNLPMRASLFVNPQAESIHFVIGITL